MLGPLGVAWETDCRYGSVLFRVELSTLLECFKKAVGAELEFYCLGTDVYKEEYSHKVLVVKAGDGAPKVLKLKTMQDLSKSSPKYDMPIFCDEVAKEWFITDRNRKEQMEFVLKFPNDVLSLETYCYMDFVGHQTVCIPSMKALRPEHCPQGVYDQHLGKYDHRIGLRYDKEIAKLECAALFVLEEPDHKFCTGRMFREIFDDLVEHLLKVIRTNAEKNGVLGVSYDGFFKFPYCFCVTLLKKVFESVSAAEKDSPSEADIRESLRRIMTQVKIK